MNGEPQAAACLTVLNEESPRSFDVRIVSGSGRLLIVSAATVLPLETPVKLTWGDSYVLAEVIEQHPQGELSLLVRHRFKMDDIRQIWHLWS
jgi:hypothetical protein